MALAHSNRGNLLRELRRGEAAIDSYDRAIAADPCFADAYFNRGVLLTDLGRWELALASFDAALALRPDFADAHCNRGVVLERLNRWEAALTSYDRAVALKPNFAVALSNRGNVLCELDRLDEALDSCDRAIGVRPDLADAHCNRGVALQRQQLLDAAIGSYDRAIALHGDDARAHFNRSTALLLLGNLEHGFAAYEWRWRHKMAPASVIDGHPAGGPRWLGGESLSGKTILLWDEQGLGDTIQFCRYAQPLADMGATVFLKMSPALLKLLKGLDGVSQLIAAGSPSPEFDVHCPLLSLPFALKTSLATIPSRTPYLKVDPAAVARWREILGAHDRFRVGLVWSGGYRPNQPEVWSVNKRRNIPLVKFAPLHHPDIEFYSLQKGEPAESELANLPAANWNGPRLIDFTHRIGEFSETAALMANLDLVIAVDTATAHVAGALNQPVWILNRFDACWRWMLDRADSPWYPSARLYRQRRAGDWDDVILQVKRDLWNLAGVKP